MKTNKVVVVIAFLLAAGVGFAQGARGMGGGGISGQPIDGTVIKPRSVQASGTQDQFMCTATTAVCEVESNISAATMTSTVPAFDIGPTATPEANDRLACISYGPSGSKTRRMCVDEAGDLNATSLRAGVAKYPNQIRLHALTQTTNYAPSIFGGNHAVFGRDGDTGANSGGVWLSYHTTDNEGIIGALSPATAWRPLSFAASTWKFRPNGNAAIADITSTGAFNSVAVSGNQAFTCTNVGCRLSLGNTGRYLVDDGTNLEFIAPLQATTFEATTASGTALTGGSASGTLLITSNTPDSLTGINGPATITMQATQALTTGDQVFRVLTSDGTQVFAVRSNANIAVGGSTGQGTLNFATYNSQQNIAQIVNDAALTEKNPVRIVHVKDVTADDASLLSIYKNSTTRVMTVSKDGLIRVNASNAAKPTCNADNRGRIYYLDNTGSGNDTAEICMAVGSSYAWRPYAFADANASFNQVITTATGSGTKAMQIESGTVICLDGSACTRSLRGDAAESSLGSVRFYGSAIFQGFIDAVSSLRLRNIGITIADSGGAGAAAYTQSTYPSAVKYTCNDADGCDITMSEVGIIDGLTMRFTNESANTVNFTDTAGVTELAGNFAMGQWDTLVLQYNTDRWVEVSRSNN